MPSMSIGRIAFVLCAVLASGCTRSTQGKLTELPKPGRDLQVPGNGFLKTYENGLTLFVVPDPFTRLVQFDVRQEVGAREDPAGKAGMAHFVEHLMFQMPVEGPGTPKLMTHIPQHTLFFNAYTAPDETHYMHSGVSTELEQYMKYTALRLNYDCAAVPESEFLREREVVRNEHRWRGQGFEAFVYDKVTELAFPEGHPYRRKLLGGDAELASITPQDACDFIKRYYTPSQASVVITGDVDPQEVSRLAKIYLEPLPKIDAPPRKPVPPPEFASSSEEIKAPVKKPTAVVVFKMPKRFTPEYAAASAALETMFLSVAFFVDGKGKNQSVVQKWYPVGLGGKEASIFGIGIETKKGRDLDRGVDEVLDAITRGFAADLKGKEHRATYDSARQRARLQVLDGVSAILGRSGTYADYLEEGAQPGFVGADLADLDNLTSERAQEVGRKVFSRQGAMIVKVVPDGTKDKQAERADFDYKPNEEEQLAVPEDIDPTEAQRPLELQDIAPPEGESVELMLENGVRVVLVKSSDVPVMDIQLIIGAGSHDAPDAHDLATLVARFWGPGDSLESQNLMNFFNLAGGIWDRDVGPHSTTYMSRGLAIYLDFIVAGLSEQVVNAEYSTGALEFWKEGRKDELRKKSAQQRAESQNIFYTEVFGKGHPYARGIVTDPKQLRDVSLKDLENFRNKHYRAANSAIIVTGGFDIELTLKYLEAYFGKSVVLRDTTTQWQKPKATAERKPAPEPKPGSVRTITQVDKERVMTDVTIAFPLAEMYGDKHAALAVLAEMLNFGVSSVRQQLGASYGVYARIDTDRPHIAVGGAVDSARAGEGLAAILAAIDKLRTGEDFDRQFAFARRNVLRGLLNAQADPRLLANQLAQAVRNGRDYEYFQEYARRVATLTPAQVKAEIERVLKTSRSVTLIEGPAAGVKNAVEFNKITGAKVLPEVIHDPDE